MQNDLISRSALLEALDKLYMAALRKTGNSVETIYELDHLAMLVRDAPAVDAEPVRHGRWGKFEKTKHKTVCSECKCPVPFKKQASGYHLAWKSNYCPNCGAKMEEKDN